MTQRHKIDASRARLINAGFNLSIISSLASDLPDHTKITDSMDDGRRDRLWVAKTPKQGEVTYN